MIRIEDIHILGKRLLVKLKEFESTTASGIILTDSAKEKNENFFEVLRIGSGITSVSVGDVVVVGARYWDSINLNGSEYKIIIEDAILWK